jgi:Na+/proline symporter
MRMALQGADWLVIGLYLAAILGVGILFARRAGQSTEHFFLGGRSLPWWLLGTSMVATTFAADTPLAVTEMVREDGVWGNWFWWIWAVSHTLAIFVFSRLWRRAGVITDAELIELRYSGRPAAVLRGVKATVMALVFNLLILGWVTQAMSTILRQTIDIPEGWALAGCGLLAVAYATTAGFWGVVVTDFLQFGLSLVGAVAFAVFAVYRVGGLGSLVDRVQAVRPEIISMMPRLHLGEPRTTKFLVLLMVGWWATHNADAGGYMMQRLSAAKNEKHAVGGALWFAVAHYALRAWPWILVALASVLILSPEVFVEHKAAYPRLIGVVLPVGLRGLLVASLLAAFMSTVDTHLNWGASYLVCDIYKRFFKSDGSEKHYVWMARLASVLLAAGAVMVGLWITSIKAAWALLYTMGAGLGPVLILRWFWWRINAWTELSALVVSMVSGVVFFLCGLDYELRLAAVAGISLVVALAVTFLTAREPVEKLVVFYKKVGPGGFWGPIAGRVSFSPPPVLRRSTWSDIIFGLVMLYGATLGMGKLLFGQWLAAVCLWSAAVGGGVYFLWRMKRSVFRKTKPVDHEG